MNLYPYQSAGVNFIVEKQHALLADEMGLGKTVQSITAVLRTKGFPCLVVCPATLKINWEREWGKWSEGISTTVVSGRKGKITPANVTIINYDLLQYREAQLSNAGFKSMILDEFHYLKSRKTKRSQAAYRIAKQISGVIVGLTGTPIVNGPVELVSQLMILRQIWKFGGITEFINTFAPPYQQEIRTKQGKKMIWRNGAKNLKKLKAILYSECMLRRTKSRVLEELPEKTRAELYLQPDSMVTYNEILNDDDLMPTQKLQKLREELAGLKIKGVLDWLEMHPDPCVIWTYHRSAGETLAMALQCPLIIGGMQAEERQQAVDDFQDGKAKRIVCSVLAAGTGITLTAASNCLFVEEPFTPAQVAQAEDRIHRIGQEYPVTAWHTIVPHTIDETMWKLLNRKQEIFDQAISVKDELLEELTNEAH